jgi:hypothetical protein
VGLGGVPERRRIRNTHARESGGRLEGIVQGIQRAEDRFWAVAVRQMSFRTEAAGATLSKIAELPFIGGALS